MCHDISLSLPKVLVEAKLSACLTNVGAAQPSKSLHGGVNYSWQPKSTVGVNGLIFMTRSGNANARGNTILEEPISRAC